jgi:hypothetical protein
MTNGRTRTNLALVLLVCSGLTARARGEDVAPAGARQCGVELDLLPLALSAADGEMGGSLQLWAGRGRSRLRVVGARIHFPDGMTDEPFRDRETTAVAAIWDRSVRPGFRGPWVALGAEAWWNEIGSTAGPERASWNEWRATAGAGWVFRAWRGLTLNPWGGVHVRLNDPEVVLHGRAYVPARLQAEVSLKLGWTF